MSEGLRRFWSDARGAVRAIPFLVRVVFAFAALMGVLYLVGSRGADDGEHAVAGRAGGKQRVETVEESQTVGRGEPPLSLTAIDATALIESDAFFATRKEARVPKRIVDRAEEWRRFPAFELLKNTKMLSVRSDASRGVYELVGELTPEARSELLPYITSESEDAYVIAIAKPAVRHVHVEMKSGIGDAQLLGRTAAFFEWYWQPLNRLGEGLDLGKTGRESGQQFLGRAAFERDGSGWRLVTITLDRDTSRDDS